MSATAIASLVARGEARYFLLGSLGGFGPDDTRGTSPATTAVASVCPAVPRTSWNASGTSSAAGGQAATLYDCRGKARQLASVTGTPPA